MRRFAWGAAAFILSALVPCLPAEGAGCMLAKDTGQLKLVERSLMGAEQSGGQAVAQEVAALRSRLNDLAQSGGAFAGKAAPIEQECQALGPELQKFQEAKEKRDAARKAVNQQREALMQDYKTNFLPRYEADQADIRAYKQQCERTFKMPEEAEASRRCDEWRTQKNPITEALKAERKRYVEKDEAFKKQLQQIDAEFDKIRLPLKARYDKYKAALEAYNKEREAWDKELRQVWAEANTLVMKVHRQNTEARKKEAEQKERMEMAQKLRGQVKDIQEALRRLNRSMQGDAQEREQWERATNQAMENAWNRGKGMIIDESLGVLSGQLDKQLASANQQIQQAVDRLAGTTDAKRREQLHAAIKLMKQQREEIAQAKGLVTDRLKDAKQVTDAVDYATSDPGDLEKSLQGTMEIVKTTLGDPKVQKALKIGKKYAAGAGYMQSIVDSSYDITTEVVSWKRINQLNRNSEAYLEAVNQLKEKMEARMQRIHELEGKK